MNAPKLGLLRYGSMGPAKLHPHKVLFRPDFIAATRDTLLTAISSGSRPNSWEDVKHRSYKTTSTPNNTNDRMRCVFFLLFAAVATSRMIPRGNLPTWTSLEVIGGDVEALTKAGNEYQGGFAEAYHIQRAETQLVNDLKQGTEWLQKEHYSEADSTEVVKFLETRLEPDIRQTTAALIQKRKKIEQAKMMELVHSVMMSLERDVTEYFTALISALEESQQKDATASWTKIDKSLHKAIRQFEKREPRGHIAERDSL